MVKRQGWGKGSVAKSYIILPEDLSSAHNYYDINSRDLTPTSVLHGHLHPCT